KANQPGLHRRLRSLPWKDVTARRYDRETGHGYTETRVTRALTNTERAPDLRRALQAVRRPRHGTDLKTGAGGRPTSHAMTGLTSQHGSPTRRGQLDTSPWTTAD
ncbi:hypothetical protein, partial [Saccharothrix sp. ST-888]|uniref:hypothetical protein n=1 Tax=Saccharothrix sp. ST-888 TaxID=1427391 RepID=UPI0005ED39C5